MGFMDLFRRAPAAAPPRASVGTEFYVGDLNDPRISDLLRGGATTSGASVTPDSALRVGVAYRCVDIICGAIASLPLDLIERVDHRTRRDATNHPLYRVLRKKPNPWQTSSEFRRLLQAKVLLDGNGYAYIQRSRGEIKALIPLSGKVSVKQNDDFSLTYTWSRKDGRQVEIPQRDMFHLRGMSFDGIEGVSVLTHARETLGLAIQQGRHASRLFKNQTSLGGIFRVPPSVDQSDVDRLKANVDDFRSPGPDAYKDLFVEDTIKYEKLGMSSVDAQFVESVELSLYTVCMFFGVLPHMVGLTSKQTSFGRGVEHQSIQFRQWTLQNWITMWQDSIERDLIEESSSDLQAKLDLKGILSADLQAKAAYIQMLFNTGSISPNEIRALDNMNPREGGDEFYVALNKGDPYGAGRGEQEEDEDEV